MATNKPHVHAEVIKQWADGKQIQVVTHVGGCWQDADAPRWCPNHCYRVKPETLKYRVALMHDRDDYTSWTRSAHTNHLAELAESDLDFARWLTDWVEVEV